MNPFRELNDYEKGILNRMLSYSFDGKDQIQLQLEGAQVREIESGDNYGSIEFSVSSGVELIDTTKRVPIELEAHDKDGVPIAVLLHIVEGKLDELEIYKADGTPILTFPAPNDFQQKIWSE